MDKKIICPACGNGNVKDASIDKTYFDEQLGEVENIEDLNECMACHTFF